MTYPCDLRARFNPVRNFETSIQVANLNLVTSTLFVENTHELTQYGVCVEVRRGAHSQKGHKANNTGGAI